MRDVVVGSLHIIRIRNYRLCFDCAIRVYYPVLTFFSNWLIFGETVKDRFLTLSPPYAPLSFLCCDPCHYSFFIISFVLFFQLPAFILPIFFKIDNFQRKNSIYFCMIRKDITMIYFQNKRPLYLIVFNTVLYLVFLCKYAQL